MRKRNNIDYDSDYAPTKLIRLSILFRAPSPPSSPSHYSSSSSSPSLSPSPPTDSLGNPIPDEPPLCLTDSESETLEQIIKEAGERRKVLHEKREKEREKWERYQRACERTEKERKSRESMEYASEGMREIVGSKEAKVEVDGGEFDFLSVIEWNWRWHGGGKKGEKGKEVGKEVTESMGGMQGVGDSGEKIGIGMGKETEDMENEIEAMGNDRGEKEIVEDLTLPVRPWTPRRGSMMSPPPTSPANKEILNEETHGNEDN